MRFYVENRGLAMNHFKYLLCISLHRRIPIFSCTRLNRRYKVKSLRPIGVLRSIPLPSGSRLVEVVLEGPVLVVESLIVGILRGVGLIGDDVRCKVRHGAILVADDLQGVELAGGVRLRGELLRPERFHVVLLGIVTFKRERFGGVPRVFLFLGGPHIGEPRGKATGVLRHRLFCDLRGGVRTG